eukprot:GHVU01140742.1.p1 GENE.GHVU01140742.1~~GHVU01140742.1.p1  ORF type:complete len:108 (+),score=3.99 GHVU01140742.1:92-415(+)
MNNRRGRASGGWEKRGLRTEHTHLYIYRCEIDDIELNDSTITKRDQERQLRAALQSHVHERDVTASLETRTRRAGTHTAHPLTQPLIHSLLGALTHIPLRPRPSEAA